MPVVIDYAPVGAVGRAAQNAYDAQYNRGGGGIIAPAEINAESLPGDITDLGGGASTITGEYGFPIGGRGGPALVPSPNYNGGVGAGEGQGAFIDNLTNTVQVGPYGPAHSLDGGQAKVRYDDGSGKAIAVTPDQRTKLQQIDADPALNDEQRAGAREAALGIKAPEQEADYTMPDGSVVRMPISKAAQLGLTGQKIAISQQNADTRSAAQKSSDDAHQALVQARNDALDLAHQRLGLDQTKLTDAEQKALTAKQTDIEKRMQKAEEQSAHADTLRAKEYVKEYMDDKGTGLRADDPELLRRQGFVQQYMQAEKAVLDRNKQAIASPAGNQSGDGNMMISDTAPSVRAKLKQGAGSGPIAPTAPTDSGAAPATPAPGAQPAVTPKTAGIDPAAAQVLSDGIGKELGGTPDPARINDAISLALPMRGYLLHLTSQQMNLPPNDPKVIQAATAAFPKYAASLLLAQENAKVKSGSDTLQKIQSPANQAEWQRLNQRDSTALDPTNFVVD